MTTSHTLPVTGTGVKAATAELEAGAAGSDCVLKVGGDWRLNERPPSWNSVFQNHMAMNVRVVPDDLGKWDTSLLLFLVHGRKWCAASKHDFHFEALPENLQILLRQVENVDAKKPTSRVVTKSSWALATTFAQKLANKTKENISFLGECTLGIVSLAKNPRRFRWLDCLVEMQRCWASSLPIVSLVSFLVGVILAFQAAIQLQQDRRASCRERVSSPV